MSGKKVMLPEGFIEEYEKCKSMKRLSKMYNVSQEIVKARLIERGVIVTKRGKRDSFRGVPSDRLLERRKINTKINNEYFAKNSIKGKKYAPGRFNVGFRDKYPNA